MQHLGVRMSQVSRGQSLSKTMKAELHQGSTSERYLVWQEDQKSSLGKTLSGPGHNRIGWPEPQVVRTTTEANLLQLRESDHDSVRRWILVSLLPKSRHKYRHQSGQHTHLPTDRTQEKGQEKTKHQTSSSHGGAPVSRRHGTNKQ